jgi:hypothetical protein
MSPSRNVCTEVQGSASSDDAQEGIFLDSAVVSKSGAIVERRSAIASSASDSVSNLPQGFFSPLDIAVQWQLSSE